MNEPSVEVPVRVPWAGPVTRAAVSGVAVGVGVVAQRPGAGTVSAVSSVGGVGVVDRDRGVVDGVVTVMVTVAMLLVSAAGSVTL